MRRDIARRALAALVFSSALIIGAVGGACDSASPEAPIEDQERDAGPPAGEQPDAGGPDGSVDGGDGGVVPTEPPDEENLDVRIDTDLGPAGATRPIQVDRRIYGVSIADWLEEDYRPTPSPDFLAYLRALEPGILRWPAGHSSQEYTWERGGDGQTGSWTLTADHVDDFMALAGEVGADVLLAINVKTSTPEAAADLVRYVNEEQGYGVRYMQIGNEPDHEDGRTESPEVHAARHVAFVDAILAVDPSVQIVAPEMMTGAHLFGIHDTVDWLSPLLEADGARIDALSWHYYPLDSGQEIPASSATPSLEHLFQEEAPDWRPAGMSFVSEIMPALRELVPDAEIWITELGEDPGPEAGAGLSDTMAGAVWSADILGRTAGHGADAILRWLFNGAASERLALLDENNQPRPNYGTWWLYANHFGDRLVRAESDDRTGVAAHAALADDGLRVVLVNKTSEPHLVDLEVEGFEPTSAERYTLMGDGFDDTGFTINGQPLTPESATDGIAPEPVPAGELLDVEVPPAAVVLVVYR